MKIEIDNEYEKLAERARNSFEYKKERVIADFTDRICRRLEELGMSQSELARRLGVSRGYVTNFLRGNVNYTVETAVKISTALAMDYESVLVPLGGDVSNCGRISFEVVRGAVRAKLNSSWRPAVYKPEYKEVGAKGAEYEDATAAFG